MYTTGFQEDKGLFSREKWGSVVDDYVDIASRLSDRRWDKIISLCGIPHAETQPSIPLNFLDRRAMYEPSSPTIGSNDE